jgi:hypothetical protein
MDMARDCARVDNWIYPAELDFATRHAPEGRYRGRESEYRCEVEAHDVL